MLCRTLGLPEEQQQEGEEAPPAPQQQGIFKSTCVCMMVDHATKVAGGIKYLQNV